MATRYLTEDELEARYGADRITALADRDGDGTADTGVVEAAILDGESFADSHLLNRYSTSDLPTTPESATLPLKQVVSGFALWFLAANLSQKGQDIVDAYQTALDQVRALASGRQSLVLAAAPDVDRSRPRVLTTKSASDATFTRAALADW